MNDEALILMFDPFDGDFGDQGDRILSDKMVTGRKAHTCSNCDGPIAVGERHRSRSGIVDGDIMSHRWCAICCGLMARIMCDDMDDSDYAMDEYETRISAHGTQDEGESP